MDERDYLSDPLPMETYHTLNNGHSFFKWHVAILLIESDMKTLSSVLRQPLMCESHIQESKRGSQILSPHCICI